ncbi:hypothetical protein [Modestobacter sp. DSM 44400]|uniref:hypothetical protein n=1 Tax=Modestobacter sp. DSM 44400 TaxID=1550230 RepID=UPI0020C91B2D|nr:hypothetical protein [Modestobacter sp. DSM 44400]
MSAAGVAFAAPAALWASAVLALLLLRGSFRVERARPATLRADIAEGARFLWRQPLLRGLAASVGIFNFATNATFTIFALFAVGPGSILELSGATYGLLLATIAPGSVAGSFLAAPCERRFGRSRSLKVSLLAGALLMVAPAVLTAMPCS